MRYRISPSMIALSATMPATLYVFTIKGWIEKRVREALGVAEVVGIGASISNKLR
jgi:hypothetical protein